MTVQPLVSILIRTKNRPVELAQAVDSVIAQTYRPLQLVIVNDGGVELDEELERQVVESNISFVSRTLSPSQGRSCAANTALEAAVGTWLLFLDDDDLLLPDHVAALVEMLEQHEDAIGAYANVRCVHFDEGKMILEEFEYNQDYDPLRLVVENFLPLHAVLFHCRVVDAGCRFVPELTIYEDWHFWLQVTQYGSLLHRPQLGAYYRTDCSGVGTPGRDKDFHAELVSFLHVAQPLWSDDQLLHLFRSVTNLSHCQNLVEQLTEERDQKIRAVDQIEQHLISDQKNSHQLRCSLDRAYRDVDKLHRDIDELCREKDELCREKDELCREKDELCREKDELNSVVDEQNLSLSSQARQLNHQEQQITDLSNELEVIYHSRSWRLTVPLRACRRFFSQLKNEEAAAVRRTRILFSYLRQGDFSGLLRHMKRRRIYRRMNSGEEVEPTEQPAEGMRWAVMATSHTLFIAHLIAEQLRPYGWSVEIMTESPGQFHHDYYVVICPQMFSKLPPGEKRIVFQMEQSVSSRWFSAGYLDILNTSLAVLDYSLDNIEFLARKGIAYPAVYYLPIGALTNYVETEISTEKQYDVLFYGDSNSSSRRREMLAALAEKFDVHIASEVFGAEMQSQIRQARLVINLHYYENALLEMPRIQECLSLGVPVVSEATRDQAEYPEISAGVRFFEQGSISAMLSAVEAMLNDPPSSAEMTSVVEKGKQRWEFLFGRFMIGMGFIPPSAALDLDVPVSAGLQPTVLSLPEAIDRRRLFERENELSCVLFDGIRFQPGWIGCGLSYATMAQNALKQGREALTVMEDDVVLPDDFAEQLQVINEYLEQNRGRWDVFSGVIADLHRETRVLAVDQLKGMTLVTIDRMTSTVFNIYSRRALELLTGWDPADRNNQTNTIDRFLEKQTDLRVVVTLPFLVGHREELYSTLWGFKNTVYLDLIAASERRLRDLVANFQPLDQTDRTTG